MDNPNKIMEARELVARAQKMVEVFKKVKVNQPCPCRSGKKFKKCCIYKVNGMRSFLKRPDVKQFIIQTNDKDD